MIHLNLIKLNPRNTWNVNIKFRLMIQVMMINIKFRLSYNLTRQELYIILQVPA